MTAALLLVAVAALLPVDCSPDVYLNYTGDILLGALFPVHSVGAGDQPCGRIQREDGIQPLEALLYTLDNINRDQSLLPGVRLGVVVKDSCDSPLYAAEQTVDFLQGFIYRKIRRMHSQVNCSTDSVMDIVGVVGAQASDVSLEVARLTRLFRVPQISYMSTAVGLSKKARYPYFFRTVSSDVYQAKAIVELLKVVGWRYASVVHTDTEYGQDGYNELARQVSVDSGVCLADPIILYDSQEDYDSVVTRLVNNTQTKVVIVFADRLPAERLLDTAKRRNVYDRLVWIGSDAWASREEVAVGREKVVEGALAVQPLRREMNGFNRYFDGLRPHNNTRNPWFGEYYQAHHNCSAGCPEDEHTRQPNVHFVRDAVYAFAQALHDMREALCPGLPAGLCPAFKQRVHLDLRDYIRNVEFPDVDNYTFRFDSERQDGPARYSITSFQRESGPAGGYRWKSVGAYQNGHIGLAPGFRSRLLAESRRRGYVRCRRDPCAPHEIQIPDGYTDGCCWHCQPCHDFEYKASDHECQPCPEGYLPVSNSSNCVLTPETYLDYTDPWALGAITFASIGLIMTLITKVVLCKYWDTPVVKACGRELSCVLILGTFLSFCTTFVIVAKPTVLTCGAMRFLIGFCYTLCYAAVVTKTNRIARIFAARTPPRFTSPAASVAITLALTGVEVGVNTLWLAVRPAKTEYIINQDNLRILVCSGVDASFMVGLCFPFLLIIWATMYAFKTRKCPGGFNETRFILFTNSINTIHWLAFVPLYLVSTDHKLRSVILAFSLSLSGIVQLGCLIFPKLYTVLFKPEKNTKGAVMTQHRSQSYMAGPSTPPNSMASLGGLGSRLQVHRNSTPAVILKMEVCHRTEELGEGGEEEEDDDGGTRTRHLTWSHYRSVVPDVESKTHRERSTSVTRATQTGASAAGVVHFEEFDERKEESMSEEEEEMSADFKMDVD